MIQTPASVKKCRWSIWSVYSLSDFSLVQVMNFEHFKNRCGKWTTVREIKNFESFAFCYIILTIKRLQRTAKLCVIICRARVVCLKHKSI